MRKLWEKTVSASNAFSALILPLAIMVVVLWKAPSLDDATFWNFAGSMAGTAFGALLAFQSAVYLEKRAKRSDRREAFDQISGALTRLDAACEIMKEWMQQPGTTQIAAFRDFADGGAVILDHLERGSIHDFELWSAMNDLKLSLVDDAHKARGLGRYEGIPVDRIWQRYRGLAVDMGPALVAARERLNILT